MIGEITHSEAFLVAVQLPKPFKLGFGTLERLPRVILCLDVETKSGTVRGFGEASLDFPFCPYDGWDILHQLQSAEITGRSVDDREQLLKDSSLRSFLMEFPAAFTAFNMAIDDVAGRFFNHSLTDFYELQRDCGRALVSLPFFDDPTAIAPAIKKVADQGAVPKLKAGQGVQLDSKILSLSLEALSQHNLECAIDFNATYSAEQFLSLVDLLDAASFPWSRIDYLEQPTLQSEGIDGLRHCLAHLKELGCDTTVMADESFTSEADAIACVKEGILLNFKIQKIGGISVAKEIENALPSQSLQSTVGATFPTALGRTYDQHAAAVLQSTSLPSNAWMPSTQYFSGDLHFINEDPPSGPEPGWYRPFLGPGLGVSVDEKKLLAHRVADPQLEYRQIRNGLAGSALEIQLREGENYKTTYEKLSGRSIDWNL